LLRTRVTGLSSFCTSKRFFDFDTSKSSVHGNLDQTSFTTVNENRSPEVEATDIFFGAHKTILLNNFETVTWVIGKARTRLPIGLSAISYLLAASRAGVQKPVIRLPEPLYNGGHPSDRNKEKIDRYANLRADDGGMTTTTGKEIRASNRENKDMLIVAERGT
jgi:hypothetical protein